MVQELTEEGHAGRHVGIVGIVRTELSGIQDRLNGIGQVIQGVDDAAFFAELFGLFTYRIGRRGVGGKSGNMRVKELSGVAGRSRKPGRVKLFFPSA